MHFCRAWCVLVGLAAIAGCSRQETRPCEPEARYSTARSAPPVQIPDDLSPPDESDAIRLPSDVGGGSITAGECLEAPPPFSGDSRPFVDADSGDQSRRQRREARREARRESPAEQAGRPDATPAEQADPPPAGDDRVIDN
jgi:uncharacterized lipoprotein